MKSTLGIILNNPAVELGALTDIRSVITLPFGARYRLVDFALSNMVNSGLDKVGIFASDKYRSLIDHIGSGQEWSMARKSQDLLILQGGVPNYMGSRACRINLADFNDNFGVFRRANYENTVISGSDFVCNIDLKPVLTQHEESGADVTMITKKVVSPIDRAASDIGILSGDNNRVSALSDSSSRSYDRVYLDMLIIRSSLLVKTIRDAMTTRSYDLLDVLARYAGQLKICYYDYPGYFRKINSIQSYYTASMDMLNPIIASRVFDPERAISTKIKDNPPTRYTATSQTINALVASGCLMEGTVRDSIIFRRNRIGEGSTVKGSILMENCQIGRNVILENCILDRGVVVDDNVVLQGSPENPVVLGKNTHL